MWNQNSGLKPLLFVTLFEISYWTLIPFGNLNLKTLVHSQSPYLKHNPKTQTRPWNPKFQTLNTFWSSNLKPESCLEALIQFWRPYLKPQFQALNPELCSKSPFKPQPFFETLLLKYYLFFKLCLLCREGFVPRRRKRQRNRHQWRRHRQRWLTKGAVEARGKFYWPCVWNCGQ